MDERIVETRAVHYCDNVTLNGVLSGCAAIAQRESVKYTCQADAPAQLCQTNEFALAAVLSNLVENAINAASKAEGEHWVSVHILPVKGQLRLEVRNTYAGEITISPQTGLPQTTPGARSTASACKACRRSVSGIRRCSTIPRRRTTCSASRC